MKKMAGRFYAHPSNPTEKNTVVLIGAGLNETLPKGHVFEITRDAMGQLHINDLGPSQLPNSEDFDQMSLSELMAKAQGRHLQPAKNCDQ